MGGRMPPRGTCRPVCGPCAVASRAKRPMSVPFRMFVSGGRCASCGRAGNSPQPEESDSQVLEGCTRSDRCDLRDVWTGGFRTRARLIQVPRVDCADGLVQSGSSSNGRSPSFAAPRLSIVPPGAFEG